MDIISLIGIFIIGVIAAFIGSMVGSGGLLSVPFLIFVGLPSQIAVATNQFGGLGLKIGAFHRFLKSGHIKWEYTTLLVLITIPSAYIGTQILLAIDETLLSRSIGVLLLVLLPLVLFKREVGVLHQVVTTTKKSIGYVLFFIVNIWAAFFGAGSATMHFYVMMKFFGFTIVESSATHKLPGLLLSLISLLVYGANGVLDYQAGIVLFVGMLIGGWLGAHTAIHKGNVWVKRLFAIVVTIAAIKLLI